VLAMLALLRVAPLLPSPTLRAVAKVMPGRDGKSRLINRTGKRCSSWRPVAMHYYFGPPMHLLSGVDTQHGSGMPVPDWARLLRCTELNSNSCSSEPVSNPAGHLFTVRAGKR